MSIDPNDPRIDRVRSSTGRRCVSLRQYHVSLTLGEYADDAGGVVGGGHLAILLPPDLTDEPCSWEGKIEYIHAEHDLAPEHTGRWLYIPGPDVLPGSKVVARASDAVHLALMDAASWLYKRVAFVATYPDTERRPDGPDPDPGPDVQ